MTPYILITDLKFDADDSELANLDLDRIVGDVSPAHASGNEP